MSRYDGYGFTSYGVDRGLPAPAIRDLHETRDGSYWVGTIKGVCRFNPSPQANPEKGELFTVFPVGDTAASNRTHVLHEDREGRLWVGTDGGLFMFVFVEGAFRQVNLGLPPDQEANMQVTSIIEDEEGTLWFTTTYGLIRRSPEGKTIRYDVGPSTIFYDRDGYLWIGGYGSLVALKPQPFFSSDMSSRVPWLKLTTHSSKADNPNHAEPLPVTAGDARLYTTANGLPDNLVIVLCQSYDGHIWMGTRGVGLIRFDKNDFRLYTTADGLNENHIISVVEDNDGNLWVGTFSKGVVKMARNGFVSYGREDGLSHPRIVSFLEDRRGALCALSVGWSINRFDGKKFNTIIPRLSGGAAERGWAYYHRAIQDHLGEWWVPSLVGIYRFPNVNDASHLASARHKALYTVRDGLPSNDTYVLFEDSRGDIWIGSASADRNNLSRWERATGTFHLYGEEQGLPPYTSPVEFCEDGAGNIWVGSYGGHIVRYRKGRFDSIVSAGVWEVRDMHLDSAGRLWVGTTGQGLIRIEEPGGDYPRLITYTTADGLASSTIRCITEDRWGRIYIGAGSGVDRMDPETKQIRHYTIADGLANSYVNAAYRDHTGALWFGMLGGLSRIIPEPDPPKPPPPVLISALRIGGEPHPVSVMGETDVILPDIEPDQRQIQIDFFGLSLAAGEILRYEYRIEGADQDWGPRTDRRSLTLSLTPGSYRFLVRAIGADGRVSQSPASVSFRILPPFWRRWWFLTIAALLAASGVYVIYYYKVKRLIEIERVRTRIATDLHDDIGSSLSQISVLSEVINRRIGAAPAVSEPLSKIADLSRDLVDSMSDIVWSINPQKDHLHDLSYRMRRFASDVFTSRDLLFSLEAPDERHDMRISTDMRREIFLVFKECVNNIVRHSCCTKAEIKFSVERGWIDLMLSDNGRGFDPDRVKEGNGLASMRKRTEKMGGTTEVISKAGQGTTVKIRIPLGRSRWAARL